jgi:hypothetical protein
LGWASEISSPVRACHANLDDIGHPLPNFRLYPSTVMNFAQWRLARHVKNDARNLLPLIGYFVAEVNATNIGEPE